MRGHDTSIVDRLAKETRGLYWVSRKAIDEFVAQKADLKRWRRGAPRFVLKLAKWDLAKVEGLVAQCVKRRLCRVEALELAEGDRVLRHLNSVRDADLYQLEPHKSLAFKALKNEWSRGRGTAEHLETVVRMLDERQLPEFVLGVLVPKMNAESSGDSETEVPDTAHYYGIAEYNTRLMERVRAESVPLLFRLLRQDTLSVDELRFSWGDIVEAAARYCVSATKTTMQSLFLLLVSRLNHKEGYSKRDFYEDLRAGLQRGDANVGSYLAKDTFRADSCFRFIKEFEPLVAGRDEELFPG